MNTIIEGDNLDTLDQVEDGYVQFVYVDPPYATLGKQNKYNDAFKSDDEWLAMMEPRLTKAYSKLISSGVIAVSIDDTNQAILKVLMDKLFGKKNFIATLIWVKAASQQTTKTFIKKHEYIICFAKDKTKLKMNRRLSEVKNDKRYKFKDEKETFWIVDGKAVFTKPGTEVKDNNYLNKTLYIEGNRDGEVEPIVIENNNWMENRATKAADMDGNELPIEVVNNLFTEQTSIVTDELRKHNTGGIGKCDPIEVVNNLFTGEPATLRAHMKGQDEPIQIQQNTHQQSDLTLSATSQTECRIIGKNDPIQVDGNNYTDDVQAHHSEATHQIRKTGNLDPIEMPPPGTLIYPRTAWRWCKKKIIWAMENNLVGFKKNKKGEWIAYFKQYKYLTTEKDKDGNYHIVPIIRSQPYETVLNDIPPDRVLSKLFGTKNTFHYAKPVSLITRLLEIFTNPNDIVLDIFAGSGTTGQAAYETNRRFILLQSNENNIFNDVLKVRLDATIGKENYRQ